MVGDGQFNCHAVKCVLQRNFTRRCGIHIGSLQRRRPQGSTVSARLPTTGKSSADLCTAVEGLCWLHITCRLLKSVLNNVTYCSFVKALGVIDEVIAEDQSETFDNFPVLKKRVLAFYASALQQHGAVSAAELVEQRYVKFRNMGKFETLTAEQIAQRLENAKDAAPSPSKKRRARSAAAPEKGLLQFVASETISGKYSLYKEQAPPAAKEYVDVPVNVAGLVAPTQPKVRVSLSLCLSPSLRVANMAL